jgi:hypothetical protein
MGVLGRVVARLPASIATRPLDHAHHVFSPCRHHAAARFSGVSTCLASASIIHVKPAATSSFSCGAA